ncbi:hypothetical protein [Celeribacter naphthalenivorans]|uniref:hypothetical protein n=1 Tax=Celeribacter naphthalenivorans TaxID=1614694 RepID=UPI001CFB2D0C|nr:hypothetical protein [Celeribacter naphthalenivorans]
MTDFYLKFADREEALAALSIITAQDDAGETVWRQDMASVAEVDPIYVETGNMLTDAEGVEYPEREMIEGFHLNVRSWRADVTAFLEALPSENLPEPATPAVVWAGGVA